MGKSGKYGAQKRRNRWWIIPVILLVVLALAAGAMWYVWDKNEFSLVLTLNGDSEITLEYGESYTEPGASAEFFGTLLLKQPKTVSVKTIGNVDTETLGTYELTYQADMELNCLVTKIPFTATQVRKVTIVDTQAPVITLHSEEGKFTFPGEQYIEEGFSAQDNYDGDITQLVQRQEADGVVTYSVSDSSGNAVQVERTIFYHDPVAPEITLLGVEEITISQGIDFVDPGCTAQDNCDGDITDRITVSGDFNKDVPGTYTLTYTVEDSYGNTDSVTRQVTVKKLTKANVTKPEVNEDKVIYLTFDDGPSIYTSKLLDVLDKYDVKATFFVVHTGSMDLLPRIAASGHKVAMHSYTHDYHEIYTSEEAYFADLEKIQDEIYQYTGQKSMLLRFPGGGSNTVSRRYNRGIMSRLVKMLEEQGYTYTDWNVDSMDAGGAVTTEAVYGNVTGGISGRKISIVLQHDIKNYSVNAVEEIIQWGLAHGYTFRAMTDEGPYWHQTVSN